MSYFLTDNVIYANRRTIYEGGTAKAVANTQRGLVQYTTLYAGDDDYDTTSGQWTAPYTGLVHVHASVNTTANIGATGSVLLIKLNNNGTTNAGEIRRGQSSTLSYFEVSATISVTKGDLLSIHFYNFSGASQSLDTSTLTNFVSFTRVADYSAGQPIGFGVATAANFGLVKSAQDTIPLIQTGTWTPTFDTFTNMDSVTLLGANYTRISDTVFANVYCTTNSTAAGAAAFRIPNLPIASDIQNTHDVMGNIVVYTASAVSATGIVLGNVGTDTVSIQYYSTNTGGYSSVISFQYKIN